MGETCLLVLAGMPPSDALITWRMEEADHSIAVDGGFLSFRHAGLVPDTLIGDLDSLSDEEHPGSEFPQLKVVHLHDQDTTDFEKALHWIKHNTKTKNLIIYSDCPHHYLLLHLHLTLDFDLIADRYKTF